MVELGKAGCHFSASRSRRGDNNEWTFGFNVIIFTITFIADDQRNIARITVDGVVAVNLDAHGFELVFEDIRSVLPGIVGDYNASNIESLVGKGLNQTEYVYVVSNAEVGTYFVFLDICSTDDDDDLRLIR